jgi:hypothetical protein
MSKELTHLHSFSQNYACCNIILLFFELQSFFEKDNFIDKFATTKENVRLCTITIEKE